MIVQARYNASVTVVWDCLMATQVVKQVQDCGPRVKPPLGGSVFPSHSSTLASFPGSPCVRGE